MSQVRCQLPARDSRSVCFLVLVLWFHSWFGTVCAWHFFFFQGCIPHRVTVDLSCEGQCEILNACKHYKLIPRHRRHRGGTLKPGRWYSTSMCVSCVIICFFSSSQASDVDEMKLHMDVPSTGHACMVIVDPLDSYCLAPCPGRQLYHRYSESPCRILFQFIVWQLSKSDHSSSNFQA